MSFPRYPRYKASGVEWLGDVPEHWEVTHLKRTVDPKRQITYGIVQAGPHIPDGVPYIRPADMTDEHGVLAADDVMRTSPEIASAYSRSLIRPGDLVCSIGPSFGKVMVTPQWLDGANLTQGTARIAFKPLHDARYYFWTLRSPFSVAQWESSVGGATFRALNLGPLAETIVSVPPLPEQTAIAEFLDRETGKIDTLVAEQQRLIELLKEKRQAVISHAVTKGLNPNSRLKPSGIEWLGDVPEHWEVTRIKRLAAAISKGTTPTTVGAEFTPMGIRFLKAENITEAGVVEQPEFFISAETHAVLSRSSLHSGDVLVVIAGATTGKSAILQEEFLPANTNQAVAFVRPKNKDFSTYINFWLGTDLVRNLVLLTSVQSAQPNLSMEDLGNIPIPLPPLSERNQILTSLAAFTSQFDTLTAEARRAIDLLQERRTALISAAVTGEIDVRQT